jgi:photosystem II stability/assembly factor-like uncharacterized protein
MRLNAVLIAALLLTSALHAQFDLQQSHTTASLRGIDTAGPDIAWASGTGGTILRTLDRGATWQTCAVPKDAAKLDFSRIYKTTDGCRTWKLVFTNPDPEGFFDTLRRVTEHQFYVLGDPVNGKFALFLSQDQAETWFSVDDPGLDADKGDGAFAASNSSLTLLGATLYFGTGGTGSPHVYAMRSVCPKPAVPPTPQATGCPVQWVKTDVPLAAHTDASGVFSIAGRSTADARGHMQFILVAVGGTYDKPSDGSQSAATSRDGGRTWTAAATPPSGYRSAVAYDHANSIWIAAGTNGADLSRDDGLTWHPIPSPDPTPGWNAIALPYVVGAKGRIARINLGALKP